MSLDELYRRYAGDVFRFAFWLSGSRYEAEDITSETFVRAWAGSSDLRLETLKAYLITIARNVFLQSLRRARRNEPFVTDVADPAPGPETLVERRDELAHVLAALHELPEVDRAALLMHASLELPYDEIARALDASVASVKVRVHRARLRLAHRLERKGANDGPHA